MDRLIRGLFLSCIFLYIISISLVCAKEEFISPEKAFEGLFEFPEIKSLAVKHRCEKFQCAGYGFGTSVLRRPEKDYPFYILRFEVTQDVEKEPGIYLAKEIFGKVFYIDAYTAKVYLEDITQETISEKRTAEGARDIEKSVLMDKELGLEAALEKIYKGVKGRVSISDEECKSLAREFFPLFSSSVNAVKPGIRLQGVMILKQLAGISKPCGECKNGQVISEVIKLLRDDDYRVRYGAVTALLVTGEKGDSLLVAALRSLLNDSNKSVKKAAVKALAKLGGKPAK